MVARTCVARLGRAFWWRCRRIIEKFSCCRRSRETPSRDRHTWGSVHNLHRMLVRALCWNILSVAKCKVLRPKSMLRCKSSDIWKRWALVDRTSEKIDRPFSTVRALDVQAFWRLVALAIQSVGEYPSIFAESSLKENLWESFIFHFGDGCNPIYTCRPCCRRLYHCVRIKEFGQSRFVTSVETNALEQFRHKTHHRVVRITIDWIVRRLRHVEMAINGLSLFLTPRTPNYWLFLDNLSIWRNIPRNHRVFSFSNFLNFLDVVSFHFLNLLSVKFSFFILAG